MSNLQATIQALPTRVRLSITSGVEITPFVAAPTLRGPLDLTNQLFGPRRSGITVGPTGPGQITIFPGPNGQPTVVSPGNLPPTPPPNLLRIDLLP